MLNAIFRPIENWPGKQTPHHSRQGSRFDSTYMQTLDLLERELNHLCANNIIVQAEVELGQVRNDGWLKSNATVRGPAVILSFTRGRAQEEFSYPCDTFTHWQANLRAIALSLEALRKVDRYGVTSSGEQYQGFKRLAAPDPAAEKNAALIVLEQLSGIQVSAASSPDAIDTAYRAAARRAHPDVGTGSPELFAKLQAAMSVLRPKTVQAMGGKSS
jgi:hypothetical protein